MAVSGGLSNAVPRVLLICGILVPVLTVATDIAAGLLTPGYHFVSQSASVLSARGATVRPLVVVLNLAGGALLIAFAVGVWLAAQGNWALRTMACLLAANALFAMLVVAYYPLHSEVSTNAPANVPNAVLMGLSVLFFVLAMVFSAVGNDNWFRIVPIGILVAFALLAGLRLGGVIGAPADESLVGVQERTMIYTEMIWLALQALVLLKA